MLTLAPAYGFVLYGQHRIDLVCIFIFRASGTNPEVRWIAGRQVIRLA
jgi:hypothetical protein